MGWVGVAELLQATRTKQCSKLNRGPRSSSIDVCLQADAPQTNLSK